MIESNKYFQSLKGFCEWFYRDARTKEENILKQNNRKWKQNRKTCKNIIKRLKTVTSKVTKTKEHREADRSKQRKWPIKWQGCHQGGQGPSPPKCAGPLSAAYTIFVICSVSCSMSLTISHPHPLPCVTPMKKYCRRCCKKGVKTLVGARKWNNSNSTWPGHWDPVCHLCFCQTFSSRGGKKPPSEWRWAKLVAPPNPNLTACYHGVSVLLQFLGGDGLPMLEEQVLKKPLKKDTRKTRLPQRNSTKCAFSF